MNNKELKKNLEKERKKQKEDAIKINTFIRLDKSSASEIDKQIEKTYLSLQKNIKFVCTNKDLMNSMLDELDYIVYASKLYGGKHVMEEMSKSMDLLKELVDKAESFEWIPFTFDEEGVLNCELPDIGEHILVSDAECMYDDESIWIDSWDSPDCGIYELESGEDLKGLAWMPLHNPYKGNQNENDS